MRHPWMVPPGYRTAPPRFNIAAEVVDRRVAQAAGDIALRDARGTVTFAELADLVARCAGGLQSLGVERGTRFLIRSPNCREAYIAFLAGVKLGAVPILANSLLGARELGHVVENGEPALAIVHAEAAAPVAEMQRTAYALRHVVSIGDDIPGAIAFDELVSTAQRAETADTGRDDPAFINYTSGTTGVPKGIVQAQRWVVANGDLARLHMPLTSADIVLCTSEFSFGWGLGHGFLWPLRNGGSVAILGARPTVERLLAAVEGFGVTVLATVPTMIRAVLAEPDIEKRHSVASLRMAYAAGEPLAEATYREWCRRFPCDLYDAYGASEFQVIAANGPGMPVKPGSMGRAHPGVDLRVLDSALEECVPGEVGTLALKADDPSLFLEYRKQPDKWREAHRGGWYITGDQAYRDEDGYLWYVGRQDDLFKSRGYLIAPKEIEDAILEHPAVIEAAVVGQYDAAVGHRIAAFVVLAAGSVEHPSLCEEIRATVRGLLAPYKTPHVVTVVPSLPKSPVGKILRRALR